MDSWEETSPGESDKFAGMARFSQGNHPVDHRKPRAQEENALAWRGFFPGAFAPHIVGIPGMIEDSKTSRVSGRRDDVPKSKNYVVGGEARIVREAQVVRSFGDLDL